MRLIWVNDGVLQAIFHDATRTPGSNSIEVLGTGRSGKVGVMASRRE
jgi:hypothetical protein